MDNRPNFNGVAVDTVSCDSGADTGNANHTTPAHLVLLPAGRLGVYTRVYNS